MPPKKTTPAAKPASKTAPAALKNPAKGTSPSKKSSGTKVAAAAGKKAETGQATATTAAAKNPEKKWTPQDVAAQTIQKNVRRFLARRRVAKKRRAKKDYEETMAKLEQEAFVKLVEMEREQAEKERKKEEEERKRKQEELKRRKRILEAAFDGDMNEIEQVLNEVKAQVVKDGYNVTETIGRAVLNKRLLQTIDCEDPNKNTPLSEASSGGHSDVIKYLISKGADINTKGAHGRSPLYRAAFAGHLQAVQVLLENGADPRVYADDAQRPEAVASQGAVKQLISAWDVKETERLLVKLEADKERRKEEDRQRRQAEASILENKVEEAEKDYKSAQKAVENATRELNKRIYEHDNAAAMGFNRPDITLQTIHDAEGDLEIAKVNFEKARTKLAAIKLELRDKKNEGAEGPAVEDLPGLKVTVRELDDVLLRDIGNRIRDAGKWPLIIDTTGQAATFLRYRDTNYLNTLNNYEMDAEKCRLAILGALRYGKPLILDMMEVDMFDTITMRFDEVEKGLLQWIMDKRILKEEFYSKILRPDRDGPAYDKNQFMGARVDNFKLFIITKNPYPSDSLLEQTYPVRVLMPK